jgi:O-antigen/teichoic acid export membrane protein
VLAIMGVGLVFSGASCAPMAGLRRNLNFRPLATAALVARLASAAIAVIMAVLGYGVWSLVAQQVALMAIKAAILWAALPWRPQFRLSLPHLRVLLSFGGLSLGSRVVWIGSIRLFMLLVGHALGVAAVGYMNIASRVVDTVFDLFGGAAHNLALSVFARRQTDRAALSRAFQQATQFAAMGMLPLFAGLAFCAPQTVALVLGTEWLPAVPLIQIMSLGAMAQFVFLFPNAAVTALGRPGLIFAMSVFSTAVVVVAFLLIEPKSVAEATAIWVSRIVITAPILVFMMYRLLQLPMTGILRAAAPPLGATLIMVAVLVPVEAEVERFVSGPLALAALVGAGALCYGLALAVLDAGAIRRLVSFLAAGLRRSPAA